MCSLLIRKNIHHGPCLQHVLSPAYSWKIGITACIFDRIFKSKVDLLPPLSQTLASVVRKKYFLHGI